MGYELRRGYSKYGNAWNLYIFNSSKLCCKLKILLPVYGSSAKEVDLFVRKIRLRFDHNWNHKILTAPSVMSQTVTDSDEQDFKINSIYESYYCCLTRKASICLLTLKGF